jgi:PAS domain S-box-containing protein
MPTEVRSAFPPEFQAALPELIDTLESGVVVIDEDLCIRAWNRWMESATGRAAESVIGQSLQEVFPNIRPVVLETLRAAIDGKPGMLSQSLHRYAFEMPTPSGGEGFEHMQQTVRFAPLQPAAGERRGAIAFIQDVTERVARERDLRAATERAEAANRSKSEFLATMSHELRTPIGAMTGYTDLILEGIYGPVTPEQSTHLERIKSVGRHLLNIVEEILLFARVEAGREELHLETVDAFAVARDAISIIEPIAHGKGLRVVCDIPATAPVVTDELKLRQILVNLLGNAVKFTPTGEIGFSARVSECPDQILFAVRDTGVGIAPENLEAVFEPFTQIESGYSRTQSGTGLGLPVSRRLAQMLGGDLVVESAIGKGSTFTASIARSAPAQD